MGPRHLFGVTHEDIGSANDGRGHAHHPKALMSMEAVNVCSGVAGNKGLWGSLLAKPEGKSARAAEVVWWMSLG